MKQRGSEIKLCSALLTKLQFVAGGKYEPVLKDNAYKIHMKLTINSVSPTDYGSYKCVSRNSLGDTDGSIKVYRKCNYSISHLKFSLFFYAAERNSRDEFHNKRCSARTKL